MAADYIFDQPALGLSASVSKSVLVATAASSTPFRVIEFTVGCDATTTGLLKVEFLLATAASTTGGSTTTAPNVNRMSGDAFAKTSALTAASAYQAEPTYTKYSANGSLAIKTMIVPLPATPYDIEYPLGREFYVIESNLLAVRLTSYGISPNSYTSLAIEEG